MRQPTHDLWEIVNAILYVARTGIAWEYLPHDLPPAKTFRAVYGDRPAGTRDVVGAPGRRGRYPFFTAEPGVPTNEASVEEKAMTLPDPTEQPDIDRPIDLTDTPDRGDEERPDPLPQHHPDDPPSRGDTGASAPDDPSVD
jgi:Putative transposase of IS4/5 family (DUF4096)